MSYFDGFNINDIGLRTRVTCPFDPTHVMNFSKFHGHFVKCQKKYPNDKRKPCPYNFSELIDPDKMVEHVEHCPYRMDYGTRNTYDGRNGYIFRPPDVDFGPDVDRESDQTMETDNFQKHRSMKQSDSDNESWDDQIDSVSVVAKRQRPSTSECGSTPSKSQNLGRGRASFFRRNSRTSRSDAENGPSPNLDRNTGAGFSILREENIRPSDKTVSKDSCASSSPLKLGSSADERLAFLKKLQDEVEEKYRNNRAKARGRGRGELFG